jgi:hypothetical protein
VNAIGLASDNTPTLLSYIRVFGYLANLPGVADITLATLNGGTADVQALFAHQLIAGTTTFVPV